MLYLLVGKASRKKKLASISDIKNRILESPTSSIKAGFLHKPIIHILLISALGLLTYSNTFQVPFHFDDIPNIVENYKLRDLSNFWPPSGSRWFGFLTFALNYKFGGLNVTGYHIANLIVHILNAILVYWLVILTFKTPPLRNLNSEFNINLIALFSGLLFISHPIQTQAVTYIVQRFTSLATFFYLLSLVTYIKFRMQDTPSLNSPHDKWGLRGVRATRYTLYAISLISAILAMKTKEIAFTLPLIITFYEFMFFDGKIKRRLLYLIPILLTMFIIPLNLVGIDKPIGDAIGELRETAQETDTIPRDVYLLTQFRVIVTYIRLLFLPINQNLDYDYPLSHSFFEPQTFLSFLFLLSLFAFAVYLFRQSRKKLSGYSLLASFGIFWFFITLSVESSIIPIRDVINEHRVYLPSLGAVIAFSSAVFYGFSYAKEKLSIKIPLLFATCILLIVTVIPLGVVSHNRNLIWKDDITLWEDVVKKAPNKARGYHNLGDAYEKKNRIIEAIGEYKEAIRLKPNLAETNYNLGNIYDKQGHINEAIEEYKIALKLKPDFEKAHHNLGLVYRKQGLIDEAIREYREAIKLYPEYAEAHNNLGDAYNIQGHLDKAEEEYKIALRLKPDLVESYYNLGVVYHKQGSIGKSIEKYMLALKLNPDYVEAHNNLGAVYYSAGRTDEAIKEYLIALRLKPDYAEAHYNIGLAYYRKGLKNEARMEFEAALKIRQDYLEARKALESATK